MELGTTRLVASPVEPASRSVRLEAAVTANGSRTTWWIDLPMASLDLVHVGPEPFIPAAVMFAAALGEDLRVVEPVDGEQLAGTRAAVRTMCRWWQWREPGITASAKTAVGRPRPTTVGLLFTRGVDSTSALVASLAGALPTVTHLVNVADVEPRHAAATAASLQRDTEAVARSVGLPLVTIRTNLREQLEPVVRWVDAHGPVLIGSALALGRGIGRIMIAGWGKDDYLAPLGQHPELDHRWSTEGTRVGTVMGDLDRVERSRLIAGRPDLAAAIKVCWQGDVRTNCGQCTKCLLTQSAFAATGSLDLVATAFERRFGLDLVRTHDLVPTLAFDDVLPALDRLAPDVADAWRYAVQRQAGRGRGLLGLDADQLRDVEAIADRDHSSRRPIGWGADGEAPKLDRAQRYRSVRTLAPHDRPLGWCVVAALSAGSARLAHDLAERWGHGAAMLVDGRSPGVPASAPARLAKRSKVRLWWSEEDRLEGVPFVEAVLHGCVPIQVMPSGAAAALRAQLPEWAVGLVTDLVAVGDGAPDDDELASLWRAAVQLAVRGPARRGAIERVRT
jgi:hypothetical protein